MQDNDAPIDTSGLMHERDALREALAMYDIAEARFRLLRIREMASTLGLPAVETEAAALAHALRQDVGSSGPSKAGPLADAMTALHRIIGTSPSR